MTVSADYIRAGLIERGLSPIIADGILPNIKDESGFNPAAVGDNGNAFGLAQWNGPRKAALFGFAQQRGMDPSNADVQMDFLMHELSGPEKRAAAALAAAQTPGEAAAAFLNHFERPAEAHRARREAAYLGGALPTYTGQPSALTTQAPAQPTQNALAAQPEAPRMVDQRQDVTPFLRQQNALAQQPTIMPQRYNSLARFA